MPGFSRHIAAVFWLSLSATSALAFSGGSASDSLQVEGDIVSISDSILPETALLVELGGLKLTSGSHISARVERGATLTGWASGPLGRLQFDVSLPKFADSCQFWMACDSLGLSVVLANDTSLWTWNPESSGCFPLSHPRAFERILEEAMRLPFESSRLRLIVAWLEGKCAAIEQVGLLAEAFDDEGRRLEVIQSAQCPSPSRVMDLEPLFASQHYRSAFLEWAQSQD